MEMAENADDETRHPDMPYELELRKDKIQVLDGAIDEIVRRAKERYAAETEAYEAKLKAREERFQETGKKPGGKLPLPPVEGPGDKEQINLKSRVMPNSDKGFSQTYNAQACAEPENMLIAEAHCHPKFQ